MTNLITLFKKIDDFKTEFSELLRQYANELRNEMTENIKKEMKENESQKLKKFEKLQLSKSNAEFFLKCIKAIKTVESLQNPKPKIPKIADEVGLTEEDVEVLVNAVRYHRIYEKFIDAKSEIYRYL